MMKARRHTTACQIPLDAKVEVTGFQADANGYTEYTIETTLNGSVYSSSHRYSKFRKLHTALLTGTAISLPATFPVAKSLVNDESVKRDRVAALNGYLVMCLGVSPGGNLPRPLRTFLQLPDAAFAIRPVTPPRAMTANAALTLEQAAPEESVSPRPPRMRKLSESGKLDLGPAAAATSEPTPPPVSPPLQEEPEPSSPMRSAPTESRTRDAH